MRLRSRRDPLGGPGFGSRLVGLPRAQVDKSGKGVQLALDVGAAGAEDDAGGARSLEFGDAGAQGCRACR